MSTVSNASNLGTPVTKKRRSSTSSSSSSSSINSTPELTSSQPASVKTNGGSRTNYFDELAELISASIPDMTSSLSSSKPDKSAILQETVNQIKKIRQQESEERDAVQQSDVSSSRPTFLADKLFGPLFLEALDGFVFVVNTEGKVIFVSKNVTSVLKYGQDDLMGKNIYEHIFVGDQQKFSGILLPVISGSNLEFLSTDTKVSHKSRSFNCRFLIKKEAQGSMEEQYENMQISAVLLPYPGEKVETTESESDTKNCVVCIAHRIPTTDSTTNSVSSVSTEQFTTKLNLTGTIMAVDTSGVSATYSQYLNKDLVGRVVHSLCHTFDRPKLNQHLKEVLQNGKHVSNVYRLLVSQDKYLHVKTSSKKFNYNQVTGEQEFVLSTHTIIRDSESDSCKPASNQQNLATISIPSPISSGSIARSSGTITASQISISNPSATVNSINNSADTFSSNYSSLSLSQDLNLNDFGLEVFGSSNWDSPISNANTINENASTSDGLGGPVVSWPTSTVALTNSSSVSPSTKVTGSFASDPGSISGNVTPSNVNTNLSPAASMTPTNVSTSTPFSNSFPFSPIQEQSEENVSTMHASATSSMTASLGFESTLDGSQSDARKKVEDSRMNPVDSQVPATNLKLRDLLTQGIEDNEASSSVVQPLVDSRKINDSVPFSNSNSKDNCGDNIILRELLNQDDEENVTNEKIDDKNLVQSKIEKAAESASERSRRASASSSGISNVLRTLLNEDEEKGYKRQTGGDRILHNLLKEEITDDKSTTSSVSESDNQRTQSTSSMDDNLLNSFALTVTSSAQSSTAQLRPTSLENIVGSHKRHSSEADGPDTSASESKRPNLGTANSSKVHLAGQNPMLASMLAQTPKQTHVVPTSIANALVSEIPQKKLPGDLEKKLVYTPVTRSMQDSSHIANNSHSSIAGHEQSNFSQQILQSELNNDAHKDNHASGLPSYQSHNQSSQGFLSNLLMAPTQSGGLPSRQGSQHVSIGPPNTVAPSAANSQIIPASGIENIGSSFSNTATTSSSSLSDFLNSVNVSLADVSSSTKTQSNDPVLSEILDAVCNMQHDVDTPITDDTALLNILDEVLDPQGSFPAQGTTSQQPNHDLSEKMAINAITRQLMSVEPAAQAHPAFSQQPPAYSSAPLAPPTYTQTSTMGTISHHPHPAFQSQNAPPNSHTPQNVGQHRPRYTTQQSLPGQLSNQGGQQFHNMSGGGITSNMHPQVRQALLIQKQKQMRDSQQMRDQQQRLIHQQQHQQIMMRTQQSAIPRDQISSSPLGIENMNDLLNNTIAPNVSLQRSTSLPDSQLSPRFNNQLPSPATSQMSPGNQRVNQQSYPGPPPHPSSQYQRTSPAPQLSPVTGFFTTTSSANSQISPNVGQPQGQNTTATFPNNRSQMSPQHNNAGTLQQQNPMLNAQLSQATYNRQGNRHSSTSSLRTLPSPNTASSPFSQQDSFPSLQSTASGPTSGTGNNNIIYQQQQQQQARIKRTISVPVPGRVNSPRTQGQFLGSNQDNILSPQSQMSPSFSHSVPSTPVTQAPNQSVFPPNPTTPTTANSQSSAPPAYSGAAAGVRTPSSDSQFSFDQNMQMFSGSPANNGANQQSTDRNRNQNVSSEYVKQEIRTMIGARNQNQFQVQTSPASSNSGLAFQQSNLEALGLSLELDSELNSGSSMHANINRAPPSVPPANSPRISNDDGRSDQKRSSLLKQLLSE